MSYNLAQLNGPNSIARISTKSDRLKIGADTASSRLGFIKTGQWMLLVIANVVCLTFIAFAWVLLKGSA